MKEEVRVTVDYANGMYNVAGIHKDKVFWIEQPINGFDEYNSFIPGYNREVIRDRRYEIQDDIQNLIVKNNPNFKYSKRAIKNVDTLMYTVLKDCDGKNGTTFALDYLKSIIQTFDSKAMSKEDYKKSRKEALKKAGIDIRYNIGLFNSSRNINILDRIKGIFIARKQNKLIGVKVKNSFIIKKGYYLKDRNEVFEGTKTESRDSRFRISKGEDSGKEDLTLLEEHPKKKDIENKQEKKGISKKKRTIKNHPTTRTGLTKKQKQMAAKRAERNKSFYEQQMERNAKRAEKRAKMQEAHEAKIAQKNEEATARIEEQVTMMSSLKSGRIVKPEVKHWTRKLRNEKDSIRNKEFVPNKKRANKIVIRGAATAMALIIAFLAGHAIKEHVQNEDNPSYETGYTMDDDTTEKNNELNFDSSEIKDQSETKLPSEVVNKEEKTDEKKIEEFKKYAFQKYIEAIVIGETPNIGNLLENETYSENPDGTGNFGYFKGKEYYITHINIITADGWYIERTEGANLKDILAKYEANGEKVVSWNFHVASKGKVGGNLGFVNEGQFKDCANRQIRTMIEGKISINIENSKSEEIR